MNKRDKIIGIVAATAIVAACAFLAAGNMSGSSDVVVKVDSFTSEFESESPTENSEAAEKSTTKTAKTEKTTKKSSSSKSGGSDSEIEVYIEFPLNLNTVTSEELTYIDGIGETTASKIIEYRNSIGSFKNRNELLNVDGIGEKTLANIWDYLYIENEDFGETQEVTKTEEAQDDEAYTSVSSEMLETSSEELTEESVQFETETETETEAEELKIELNSAEFEDLMKVPEFDEEICNAILELREKIDYFSNVTELLYADGMTKNLFSQTEKYFYVELNENIDSLS